jgi:hypothetical protein
MDIEKNGLPRSKRALKELREEARRALILPSEGQDEKAFAQEDAFKKEQDHRREPSALKHIAPALQ